MMGNPNIRQFDHVTVNVVDVDRSKKFYGEVLGLDEVPRPPSFDFPGAWFQVGNQFLHLVGVKVKDPPTTAHFAIWTEDLRQMAGELEAAGLVLRWSAHKIAGVDRFFVKDPDENLIEFQGCD